MLMRLYRSPRGQHSYEECIYVESSRALTPQEVERLFWLLSDSFKELKMGSVLRGELGVTIVEVGPRLSVETSFSSNAVSICRAMDLPVTRIERSERYRLTGVPFAESNFDPLTQEVYRSPLTTFDSGITPEPVCVIDILGRGMQALVEANKTLGLGMDDWDVNHWYAHFVRFGRNPTDVELFQIGNGNSEHSRHWFFRGIQVINGIVMPETLMDVVKATLQVGSNSLVAFHDNAGVMRGTDVLMFAPVSPGQPSSLHVRNVLQHISATAETHNHPTLIAPFPGAETGAGGRIRDSRAVGRGGLVHAGLSGYCVGNLHSGLNIPGEKVGGEVIRRSASPLDILMQGSNGVSDYGNKIGEPLIGGFCRSFGQMVGGARREFRKPVLYSAGVGRLLDSHVQKRSPEKGMLIVRIGGPAYRIGVGGGSASSMIHGAQDEGLDFKSVQRGNAEMENRVNRVIQACAELLEGNPIESIHDQGAGGPSNVLTELMEPVGGKVDIRNITVGDKTMSVLEIWVAEYQEGYGLLVRSEHIGVFKSICERERVNCEVVGEITGDGNVVVEDSHNNTTPVNLSLKDILGELPRKRFESERPKVVHQPLKIPHGLTVEAALEMIFKLPHVGSKGFLVRKVDRSVTGLVARQQCCGPTQVPVSDVAVTADGYFGQTGVATALGEQPIKVLIDSKAGARMAVAEMLTNLCSAKISKLSDVKCRANWMWAAKRPGEGALLNDAATAMRDIMLELGIAIDGGKDSLSMATQVGDDLVVSPGELVIMGYAPVPDITKVVTPALVGGVLGHIDFGLGKQRLSGGALAQAVGQLGDESPDIDDSQLVRRAFLAVQELIERGLITAYHDVSDGGLITAVAEMCIAGNRGVQLKVPDDFYDPRPWLFSEEAGMVFEYSLGDTQEVARILALHDVPFNDIGSQSGRHVLYIRHCDGTLLDLPLTQVRAWWEATSTKLERRQANPETVEAESKSHANERTIQYKLSFAPTAPNISTNRAPKVAILREEGTNGEREMAAAFYTAGLEPWDISMSDLLEGRVTTLDDFSGLVFPGGFSYADVFGSAKGWAGQILFNPRAKDMFDRFYARSDTFSLGVCNGCQLMSYLGQVPYRNTPESMQPRLVRNNSGRFESRWVGVKINPSPSIFFAGMEGSVLGINIAHGEGQFLLPDSIAFDIGEQDLVPLVYVDADGKATDAYPYNPNGSPGGMAALCSTDGRHLAMMPHPERSFLKWQWPWMPEELRSLASSPWLQMFQNARTWLS